MELKYTERIKEELRKKPYTYVRRETNMYTFGDSPRNCKPCKELGEML